MILLKGHNDMDECLSPGFLWPYGSPALKEQLTVLTWNAQCRKAYTLTLMSDCTKEQKREIVKQIAHVQALMDSGAEAIFKLSNPD